MSDLLINIWNNVYPGIVGGLLMWGYARLRSLLKNNRIERKYKISGSYLTMFADMVGGEEVMQFSPAILKQTGLKITGTTQMDERVWEIQGEISTNGYIYGAYRAQSFADDGIGNFFLHMSDDGLLDGLWSGYDSKNKTIYSGRYVFMRSYDVNYRRMKVDDLCIVAEIVDNVLGKNYLDAHQINAMLGNDEYICYVATFNERIVGVAIGIIFEKEKALKFLKIDTNHLANIVKLCDRIGIVKTIAVLEKFQKRGVGSILFDKIENDFVTKKVHAAACVAWRHNSSENIGGILKRKKYHSHYIIEDYWKEESILEGFSCPICGNPPCRCSADIYFKGI